MTWIYILFAIAESLEIAIEIRHLVCIHTANCLQPLHLVSIGNIHSA